VRDTYASEDDSECRTLSGAVVGIRKETKILDTSGARRKNQ